MDFRTEGTPVKRRRLNNATTSGRNKRRKTSRQRSVTVVYSLVAPASRRKRRIYHLPTEVLSMMFCKFFNYSELAERVIPVCDRFCQIGVQIMNNNLIAMENRIVQMRAAILEATQNSNVVYRFLRILDLLYNEFLLLQATIWRYSYFMGTVKNTQLLNQAGVMLDHLDRILEKKTILPPTNLENLVVTMKMNELNSLQDMMKSFYMRFERRMCSEKLNDPFHAGSKLVDMLDAFLDSGREVVEESCDQNNICQLKLKYRLKRAWFTAMELTSDKPVVNDPYLDIRYMLKRLRRLARANNTEVVEGQYLYQDMHIHSPENRFSAIYCGYGEICNKFYFYGILAANFLYHRPYPRPGILEDDSFPPEINEWEEDGIADSLFTNNDRPDLTIEVEIRSPLYLAPWKYLQQYNNYGKVGINRCIQSIQNNMERYLQKNPAQKEFEMNMVFTCSLAKHNRLPFKFKYSLLQTIDAYHTSGEDISSLE